jgi:hypothetical protein
MGGLAKGPMLGVVPLGGSQTRSLEGAGWGEAGGQDRGEDLIPGGLEPLFPTPSGMTRWDPMREPMSAPTNREPHWENFFGNERSHQQGTCGVEKFLRAIGEGTSFDQRKK